MLTTESLLTVPDYRAMVNCKNTKVKRCLFGAPDDQVAVRADLVRQLATIAKQDSQRWNFDFVNEKPLDGQYQWKLVTTSSEAVTREATIKTPNSSPLRDESAPSPTSPEDADSRLNFSECLSTDIVKAGKLSQTTISDYYAKKKRSAVSDLSKSPKSALKRKRSMEMNALSSSTSVVRPKRRCRQN